MRHPTRTVIARLKGGLGNQLFAYAAARRLAIVNDADLALDTVTGFVRDRAYRRLYALDRFHVAGRQATIAERLHPCERYRRGLMKWQARRQQYHRRRYIEQDRLEFDPRLLLVKVERRLYLDGVWAGEGYFSDVEDTIRQDLRINAPTDALNLAMADQIAGPSAVAVHVRWFQSSLPPSSAATLRSYYISAMDYVEGHVDTPIYYVFSDAPGATRAHLPFPTDRTVYVSHNSGSDGSISDLWLMTRCRHFITADSTFSWWGAWLGGGSRGIVITPRGSLTGFSDWGFEGLCPDSWIRL